MIRLLAACCLLVASQRLVAQTSLDTAVNFTVNDVHGTTHRLFDYLAEDKLVLLDFFTVTCGPCAEYTPEISQTYSRFGCNTGNVVVLGVNWGATNQEVIEFGETYGARFPEVSGSEGNGNHVVSDYGILSYPTVILVLPDHSIPVSNVWPPESETLDSLILAHGGLISDCSVGRDEVRFLGKANRPLNIFPNPSESTCFVQCPEGFRCSTLEIISLTGQILQRYSRDNPGNMAVDVSLLNAGCYIIRAIDSSNRALQGSLLKLTPR